MPRNIRKIRTQVQRRQRSLREGLGDARFAEERTKEYRWVLRQLINRSGGCCEQCGEQVALGNPSHLRAATVEHHVPRSRGGADTLANYRLFCSQCNSQKGNTLT